MKLKTDATKLVEEKYQKKQVIVDREWLLELWFQVTVSQVFWTILPAENNQECWIKYKNIFLKVTRKDKIVRNYQANIEGK